MLTCDTSTTAFPRLINIQVDYATVQQNYAPANHLPDISAFITMMQANLTDKAWLRASDISDLSAFSLPNNMHILSGVNFKRRRIIQQGSWWRDTLSTLGIHSDYTEFNIYSLVHPVSAVGDFPNNTASLTMNAAPDAFEVVHVEDYREKTVLIGLASVGGVFTVADGIFAMIFGSTLITLLFGTKPLSPFGITGMLARSRIHAAVHERYPLLKKEVNEGGMASFLKDTAVELAILDSKSKEEITEDDPDPEVPSAEDNLQLRTIESRRSSQYISLAQADRS
ncbi:hypothetical protein PLICRDRAFT_54872 [Plicaturopsis crispa FD-325 SS-3]|nr:hypothetical protein PLICRDRAFT_54872 [Plicaturopsis crispa FD-325 SS-3]